jgi:hypothetical protein
MTRLVDDIDGSHAVTTLSFGLDGHSYEIDLSESHLSALQEALAPFITAARAVPNGPRPARIAASKVVAAPKEQVSEVVVPEAPTPRPSALDSAPVRQPSPGRERTAASARSKPAPLVADPFNPRS